jgi:hypothetical protein
MVGLLSGRKMFQPQAACVLQGMARARPRKYGVVYGITSLRMHNGSILPARVCIRDDDLLPPCPLRYVDGQTFLILLRSIYSNLTGCKFCKSL